jgi:4-amino-4-deoxychorismate lyase
MSRLLETVKIKNRQMLNLYYHNERMNRSRMEFFGCTEIIDLKDIVSVPGYLTDDVYKCRIIYNPDIESVEFERYNPKKIQTLKIVECNNIDYSYKFADRSVFAELQKQRGGCDDILIVKNGFITDTSFSNIVFFDGEKAVTPSTPLLKGTMREKLIKDGKISESDICLKDLQKFQSVKLINAMLDLDDSESIDVNNIMI